MKTQDDEKERGIVARLFEEWSRPLGFISLIGLSYIHAFKGISVHDIAWYAAGLLLAGEHFLELSERIADKIIKALNLVKK